MTFFLIWLGLASLAIAFNYALHANDPDYDD